jgi:serine/threonine-protein kinase
MADLFTQARHLVDDSTPALPVPPERVGPFDLVFKLASGGMADVYLARDARVPGFERPVAIKRIHPRLLNDPSYRKMFLDEARIAFQVAHPNVCSVLDFGDAGNQYYLAMPYLVGEPLARLMNRLSKQDVPQISAFAACRLARIIADACAGLHAAHDARDADGSLRGVVHRDITPRNLFLLYDGTPKVLDFGIASAMSKTHQEQRGELRGNLAYMAPEQLTGGDVDLRIDIWAMGVVLWEMLAMKRLFKGATPADTAFSVTYDEVRPPSEHQPDVPEALDAIVLKALQREPRDRWESAHAMQAAIREVLDTQPVVVGPADLVELMAELFPMGEARKTRLGEMARRGNNGELGGRTRGEK